MPKYADNTRSHDPLQDEASQRLVVRGPEQSPSRPSFVPFAVQVSGRESRISSRVATTPGFPGQHPISK